jgi:hypothetical protein
MPIYNIWKQQTKTEASSHFGNSEVRWTRLIAHIDDILGQQKPDFLN